MFRLEYTNITPSVFCFWCGKEKKDFDHASIGFNGTLFDYDPCPECEEIFNKGVLVMGVTKYPIREHMAPIAKDQSGNAWYPDATYFVASSTLICDLYKDNPQALKHTLATKRMMMPSHLLRQVIEQNMKEDSENESNQGGASDSDPRECD